MTEVKTELRVCVWCGDSFEAEGRREKCPQCAHKVTKALYPLKNFVKHPKGFVPHAS